MTGEVVDAARAEKIGLVTEVVAHERLLDRAVELATQIAEVPGPTMLGLKEIYTAGAATGDRSRPWPPRRESRSRSTATSRGSATSSAPYPSATNARSSRRNSQLSGRGCSPMTSLSAKTALASGLHGEWAGDSTAIGRRRRGRRRSLREQRVGRGGHRRRDRSRRRGGISGSRRLGVDGDVDALLNGLEKGLAGRPLDILVNNAAISTSEATIEAATREQFDREFAINVRAPFFITQRALPLIRDGGHIINISSGVTWFATPQIVYSMTKGALNVMGRALALAVGGRGITVNNVSPGITDTDMNSWLHDSEGASEEVKQIVALKRIGPGGRVADAVAFFASARQPMGDRADTRR